MCYVHNQWYDISCATVYINRQSVSAVPLMEDSNTSQNILSLLWSFANV